MAEFECAFCDIAARKAPAKIVYETADTLIIVPHNPVVPGHVIAIPKIHARDAADRPDVTGYTMADVSRWALLMDEPFNLITSCGSEATQSIFHLHIHYVPRHEGDGLSLPWTGQRKPRRGLARRRRWRRWLSDRSALVLLFPPLYAMAWLMDREDKRAGQGRWSRG